MFRRPRIEERLENLERTIYSRGNVLNEKGELIAEAETITLHKEDFYDLMMILKDMAAEIKAIKLFG